MAIFPFAWPGSSLCVTVLTLSCNMSNSETTSVFGVTHKSQVLCENHGGILSEIEFRTKRCYLSQVMNPGPCQITSQQRYPFFFFFFFFFFLILRLH